MTTRVGQRTAQALLAAAALAAVAALSPGCAARSPSGRAAGSGDATPVNAADASFMSGMIHHHAQALVMAAWAPTHGASPEIRTLSERIVVGQRDEIVLAQRWLEEQGEPVPDVVLLPGTDPPHADSPHAEPPNAGSAHADSSHAATGAMDHGMHMPGMLTPDELERLDRARGPEFDRLFLTLMIRHHQGAVTMVEQLFAARGAAQDEAVFRFAADVQADQLAEIDRMTRMLAELPHDGR